MFQSPVQIYYYSFIQDDKNSRIKLHEHPFWQLEILYEGSFEFTFENQTINVKAPAIIFIPPKVPHTFNYDFKFIKLTSIKFQSDAKSNDFLTKILPVIKPINLIVEALEYETIEKPTGDKPLLEDLTQTLLAYCYADSMQKSENILNKKIIDIVESKKGKPISIQNIADQLFLSTSYISSYFRKNNSTSLKEFIDERRLYYSKTLLLYSDFNIGEIASELKFNDLYSFSHFFKRKTNMTPSEFKKSGDI